MTDEQPALPPGGDPTRPPLSAEGQRTVASVRRALEETLAQLESQEQAELITLIEAGRQIARSEGETRAALEQGAQEAANPELRGEENPETRQSRNWLLQALIRRMGPTQRLDTHSVPTKSCDRVVDNTLYCLTT